MKIKILTLIVLAISLTSCSERKHTNSKEENLIDKYYNLQSKPVINIQGRGATAKDKTNTQNTSDSRIGNLALGGIFGIIFMLVMFYIESPSSPANKLDTIEDVFFTLNKAGLAKVFPQIIKMDENVTYIGTGFHLAHGYLQDSASHEKYVNALKGLSTFEMAENSKGIIFYLIYKIRKKENNSLEANEYLQRCKTDAPFIYQRLMEHDPYYNLNILEEQLKRETDFYVH